MLQKNKIIVNKSLPTRGYSNQLVNSFSNTETILRQLSLKEVSWV